MTVPAAIAPDTRDWTYVITEGCKECGFTPQPPELTGQRLRASIPTWRNALASATASRRPAPAVWSAVEHHVHDVAPD